MIRLRPAAVVPYPSGAAGEPDRHVLVADPEPRPVVGGDALPPLPGARQEVSAIARLLPRDRVETLVGQDATEDRVRAAAGDRAVVHLATHGLVTDDAPLDSFLALAPARAIRAMTDGWRRARSTACA